MTATAGAVQVILQAIVVVLADSVVSRVTARAGRLVSGRRPIHRIRIGVVAVGAVEAALVIERFVAETGVTIVGRNPRRRAVAQTAILRSIEVPRIHAGGIGSVVA